MNKLRRDVLKYLQLPLLCAPLGAVGAAFAASQKQALPPIKLALVESLSGPFANTGEAVFRNLLWATEREPEEDAEIDLELDDDSADQIEGGSLDLGQYAVEQLALSLDPFPRKLGAVFEQPKEPGEISPFAVLKGLKSKDGSGEG